MIILKSPREIALIRDAGRIVAEVHAALQAAIRPGITTGELDELADRLIQKAGAVATFKGYHGFPASVCTSINAEVVHGIPDSRRLLEGDIIAIDLGVTYKGYVADAAYTWPVGDIAPETSRLLAVTQASLHRAIAQCVPGRQLGDIGWAVQGWVEENGFTVVRDYVGHGVGTNLHEDPQIPNYGTPGSGITLRPGMVLAIEPMVNAGAAEVRVLDDKWTVVTGDGQPSAHFEHTVAVTENGPEILTAASPTGQR